MVTIYVHGITCLLSAESKIFRLFTYPIENIPNSMTTKLMNTKVLLTNSNKEYPPVISNPTVFQRTIKNGEIPKYAIDFSPVIQLHSKEKYYPYDINLFIRHFQITKDQFPVQKQLQLSTITHNDENLYMTAIEEFCNDPDWILGTKPDSKGLSDPAVLIVVDKGNGWVDAYWFYFYAFNLGPTIKFKSINLIIMGPIGNHVGDWEHTLVRFYNGKPILVWLSAHSGGNGAYYQDIPKFNHSKQPLIYSALGTHANYVTPGKQNRDPSGILSDRTDSGAIWIPSRNYLSYTFDGQYTYIGNHNNDKQHLGREQQYGSWLHFLGHWGDQKLSNKDFRQRQYMSQLYKYVDGPQGPLTKNLMRVSPCPNGDSLQWWKWWARCNVQIK